MEYNIFLPSGPVCIKEEVPDQVSSLISSPVSSTGHTLPSVPSTPHRKVACQEKGIRDLTLYSNEASPYTNIIMSGYPSWSGSSGRRQNQGERGTPAPEDQGYRMPQQYMNVSQCCS